MEVAVIGAGFVEVAEVFAVEIEADFVEETGEDFAAEIEEDFAAAAVEDSEVEGAAVSAETETKVHPKKLLVNLK